MATLTTWGTPGHHPLSTDSQTLTRERTASAGAVGLLSGCRATGADALQSSSRSGMPFCNGRLHSGEAIDQQSLRSPLHQGEYDLLGSVGAALADP